ncbi:MAG: SH3 domain-containing protein [Thiolinea sp.]
MQSRFIFVLSLWLMAWCLPVGVQAADSYQVVKVESWDVLNMRSGAGTSNAVVAKLPSDATGVTLTGGRQQVGSTTWVEVSWQGKRGWVSQAYLAKQAVATPAVAAPSAPVARPEPVPEAPVRNETAIIKNKQSGMWVLECGSASPFWKVECCRNGCAVRWVNTKLACRLPTTVRNTANATMSQSKPRCGVPINGTGCG